MVREQSRTSGRVALMGMVLALCIILTYTPLGMIPLPMFSVTIAHVPVIVMGIVEGPVIGAAVGLIFGLCTLVKAMTMPGGLLDPLFINPLVSVLPRILVGVVACYAYRLGSKLNDDLGVAFGAAIGSVTNTVGCLGILFLLYGARAVGDGGTTAGGFIISIISVIATVGLAEMLAAVIISYIVVKAVKRATKR